MYKIVVSPRTQREIETAIDYYVQNSADAPAKFIGSLKDAYAELSINPFKRLRYKNIRAIQLNKFPFLLYYLVNSFQKTVLILSCFHNKRNPDNRP